MAQNKVHCSKVQADIIQGGSSEDNNLQTQEAQADNLDHFNIAEADIQPRLIIPMPIRTMWPKKTIMLIHCVEL
jgi:hypothetical protein